MPQTPNERIREARERAGLELGEVAERLDITFAHCRDLEDFEDEAEMTLSLRELQSLGRILGLTPHEIVEGLPSPERRMTFTEFSQAVAASIRAQGGDVEAWGERAGWDVAPLLEDPEQVGELNVDGLKDIAGAAGVDWRAVLPGGTE